MILGQSSAGVSMIFGQSSAGVCVIWGQCWCVSVILGQSSAGVCDCDFGTVQCWCVYCIIGTVQCWCVCVCVWLWDSAVLVCVCGFGTVHYCTVCVVCVSVSAYNCICLTLVGRLHKVDRGEERGRGGGMACRTQVFILYFTVHLYIIHYIQYRYTL